MKPYAAFATKLLAVLIGLVLGLGIYTFIYAKGYSYLANDPAACTNCHVMRASYDGWLNSSHRGVATCNDCHTPGHKIAQYATKTSNGFFHSLAFTSGRFPDSIQIKPRNREVTEEACRRCHEGMVQVVEGTHRDPAGSCVRCHSSVGHAQAVAETRNAILEGKQP